MRKLYELANRSKGHGAYGLTLLPYPPWCVACLKARFARTLPSRLPYGVA